MKMPTKSFPKKRYAVFTDTYFPTRIPARHRNTAGTGSYLTTFLRTSSDTSSPLQFDNHLLDLIDATSTRIKKYDLLHKTKHQPHMDKLQNAANKTWQTADRNKDKYVDTQEYMKFLQSKQWQTYTAFVYHAAMDLHDHTGGDDEVPEKEL